MLMSYWWVLPAVIAFIAALFVLNGVVSLFRGRWVSGPLKMFGGAAVLASVLSAVLLAQNVQTYARLTYERPVATIQLKKLAPQYFEVSVIQPPLTEGQPERSTVYPVNGDDWRIEAQVLKWKPWANVLGLDTQYRLDRLSGRYQDIEQERTGARSVHALDGGDPRRGEILGVTLPWNFTVWHGLRRYREYVDAVDTLYGGATYMPMTDGARYEVWITQSGLIARPANDAARNASAGGWTRVP